jgi:UBA-like domain (DUF1421)
LLAAATMIALACRTYMPPPTSAPPPPQQSLAPRPAEGPQQMSTQSIINDICQMGFARHQVEAALQREVAAGRSVDLNAVVDALMSQHS